MDQQDVLTCPGPSCRTALCCPRLWTVPGLTRRVPTAVPLHPVLVAQRSLGRYCYNGQLSSFELVWILPGVLRLFSISATPLPTMPTFFRFSTGATNALPIPDACCCCCNAHAAPAANLLPDAPYRHCYHGSILTFFFWRRGIRLYVTTSVTYNSTWTRNVVARYILPYHDASTSLLYLILVTASGCWHHGLWYISLSQRGRHIVFSPMFYLLLISYHLLVRALLHIIFHLHMFANMCFPACRLAWFRLWWAIISCMCRYPYPCYRLATYFRRVPRPPQTLSHHHPPFHIFAHHTRR